MTKTDPPTPELVPQNGHDFFCALKVPETAACEEHSTYFPLLVAHIAEHCAARPVGHGVPTGAGDASGTQLAGVGGVADHGLAAERLVAPRRPVAVAHLSRAQATHLLKLEVAKEGLPSVAF